MFSRSFRVLMLAALVLSSASIRASDFGRTVGEFGVSPAGAATYRIPIWMPPGPNGVQPSVSLTYNSQGGNGLVGVGWNLNAVSSIERCARTAGQDGNAAPIDLSMNDRYCIGGNRLRVASGMTYGTASSIYYTELADYSRITASSATIGNGPQSFTVEAKSGLKFEYGNSSDSRVVLNGSVLRWMLNKVYDRNGNNYVVTYNNATGFAVPNTISWTPSYLGSTSYLYQAKFNYSTSRADSDSYRGRVGGFDVVNRNRLESIQIWSGSNVVRKYLLSYDSSTATGRSRLISATECADDAGSNCWLPISFGYQAGEIGTVTTATSGGSTGSSLKLGKYDFNGDGRSDLIFVTGSTWKVAFSTGIGMSSPVDTGVSSTAYMLVDRFLANHQDGLLVNVSGTWYFVGYNGSSFVSTSTGIAYPTGMVSGQEPRATDNNGDGIADLLWGSGGNLMLRLNTTSAGASVPTFGSAFTAASFVVGAGNVAIIDAQKCPVERRCDINGDGRSDLIVNVVSVTGCGIGGCTITNHQYDLLALGNGYSQGALTGPIGYLGMKFNDDRCVDRINNSSPTTLLISGCNSGTPTSVTMPAAPTLLLDWNGDSKTDLLVNSGGFFGVYLSTGSAASPFSSLISTSVAVPTGCSIFVFDLDGDGFDDIGCVGTSSPYSVSYYTHAGSGGTLLTQQPDLLNSITDGFGVNISPSYVSTSQGNYTRGTGTQFPLVDSTDPIVVVSKVTRSDGIGGTFNQTYNYVGARENRARGEFAGFERVDETDSRNSIVTRTTFDQLFPVAGMVKKREILQPSGTTIFQVDVTNSSAALESPPNQRLFAYVSASTATEYEVGGTWNGSLLRTTTTSNTYDTASGTLYDQTVTTTEASGANGVNPGGSWSARTYLPLADLVSNYPNWCFGLPKQIQQINSSNRTYGTAITRTTNVTWNESLCRPTQIVAEQGSSTLQVTTDIGYDSFGNVNSTTVTGKKPDGTNMSPRMTSTTWVDGTFTTGLFPLSERNALNHESTFVWDYDHAVPLSTTDPNGLTTVWHYDGFGRRDGETRPDNTSSDFVYRDCAVPGYCPGNIKTAETASDYDSTGAPIARVTRYRDQFDRVVQQFKRSRDWISTNTNVEYDSLGRVSRTSAPCFASGTGCATQYWTSNTYDLIGRLTQVSQPVSDTDGTPQSTIITYLGLTTRIQDPQGKYSDSTLNAAGQVARSEDQDGYYQDFDYDAFGDLMRVVDSAGALQSSTYNLRGMLTSRTDMDLGAWTYLPDSLGQVAKVRDAKTASPNWTQEFTYDELGRLTSRVEAEGTSTFEWGTPADNTASNKYIGFLKRVYNSDYSERYTRDALGRLTTNQIDEPGGTYYFDYTYNSMGAVDTLTYPTSTSSYRLKLQFDYLNGHLHSIRDYNSPTTYFWTANAGNPRDQIVQETLGNSLFVSNRVFDAVNGRLKSIQSGPGGSSSLQNLAYEWYEAGDLKKRIDINQSNLTEEFFYDNLHRLDYSKLNGVQNLDVDYDSLGNIINKSDVGSYTYHPTRRHQVTSTSNGWSFSYDANGNMTSGRGASIDWTSYNYPSCIRLGSSCSGTSTDYAAFSYTPDRQYWKQVSNYASTGTATTIYIGGLLEKVTTSAGTDYRHMIRAGSSTIIVSRQSSGTNSVYYVTSDHLGSSSAITDSSGNALVNESFDAFGRRRGSNWSSNPSAGDWTAIAGTTRRGFTEHTMLDNLNLIHMNGRVFDPVIGRFLRADPFIDGVMNTQGWNRYSYLKSNPLSATDLTGFEQDEDEKDDNGVVVTADPPEPHNWSAGDFDTTAPRATDFFRGTNVGAPTSLDDQVPIAVVDPNNPEGLEVIEVCGDCNSAKARIFAAWNAIDNYFCFSCGLPGADFDAFLSSFGPGYSVVSTELNLTKTVAGGLKEIVKKGAFKGELARPFLNSQLLAKEIMAAKKGVPDPGGVPGALRWDVPGTFRGAEGIWELVVKDDLILHFNFVTP